LQRTLGCPFFRKAFGWSVPIGALGGLIGLGGGEFRLPVLIYGVGFGARSAVPLNLMVSLITLAPRSCGAVQFRWRRSSRTCRKFSASRRVE
jgi:uncharacterized membrane protein YfcA